MSDSVKINDLGIQIHFATWERFNLEELGVDGVILFQYLVHHFSKNVIEWTHSDNDLQYELGIKRARLKAIRDKFKGMGILTSRIVRNQYDNKITAYRLEFAEVAKLEKLRLIYRTQNAEGDEIDLAEIIQKYKTLASEQPKIGTRRATLQKQAEQLKPFIKADTKGLSARLDQVATQRREQFVRDSKEGTRIPVGNPKFAPSLLPRLESAIKEFGREYIENAFRAYCDHINAAAAGKDTSPLLPTSPRNTYAYFLSPTSKSSTDSFPVIRSFGEYHSSLYGREK